MKPIEKLSFCMVGIGLIFVSLAVIRLNEHVDALEQNQKVIHGWITVNDGKFTNEPFVINNREFHYWISHEDGKTNEHVELVPDNP